MSITAIAEPTETQPDAAPAVAYTKPPTMSDHAVAWAARGFAVFPLQENGKIPLPGSSGHLAGTTDPEEIRMLWTDPMTGSVLPYNIGATPRDGQHLVVDLDEKEDRGGIAAYEALGGTIGGLVVRTPTGGLHVYTRGDDLRTGAGRLAPGIDTRGPDGYVVAPGSTIDGVTYEVIEDGEPLPCPQFVVDKIGTRAAREIRHVTQCAVESDQPHNIERAIEVAKRHPPAISGTWHTLGYPLGCELARCALSPEMALQVAGEHWKPRGEGFKSQAQFERDVLGGYHDAVRDGEHGVSSLDAQRLAFDGLTIVPPPAEPQSASGPPEADPWLTAEPSGLNGSRIVGLSPSHCANVEAPPYIIKGLLAKGQVGMVAALPASGKSCFVPLLAYRLAQGQTVFGRRTRPGRVAYFGLEDERGMVGRIDALRLKHGDAPDFRLFVRTRNLLTCPEEQEEIKRIVRIGQPDLIVFDTIRAGWRGLSENDADEMGQVVAFARDLTGRADGEPGPSVILVHHTTKAGGQTAAGSGVLEADADVTMFLAKDDETNIVTVSFGKNRNGESFGQELCFGFESVRIGTDCDGDPVTRPVALEVDPRTVKRNKALSRTQAKALEILEELVEGSPAVPGNTPDSVWAGTSFGGAKSAPRADWSNACEMRGLSTATDQADRARVFRKAVKELVELKLVVQLGDQIFLLKRDS